MSRIPRAGLTPKGAERVRSGHPWVFAGDVTNLDRLPDAPVVTVADPSGRPLGTAFLSRSSPIALRILSRRDTSIDGAFWRERIREALSLREALKIDGDAYRLLYGEGDLTPSIIVDRYGPYLAAQFLSAGADRVKDDVVRALVEVTSPEGILERSDGQVRRREGLAPSRAVLHGTVPPVVRIRMNGLRFEVDLQTGQKTGGFLDQRENYVAARRWATGRVADCFCYAGGFAIHAASSARVRQVTGVDSSEPALEIARQNAGLNRISDVRWIQADGFGWLKAQSEKRSRFDTVILDPPAFARSRSGLAGAMRGYKEINLRAMNLLVRGGILVTCSCSYQVSAQRFTAMLQDAARDTGRCLQILERRGQPADHPVLAPMPETAYLKCFILRVL